MLATQIARPPETGVNLAAELRATGELIGHVSLMIGEHRQGEIGFIFHPDHQGRGYATEAARRAARARLRALDCTASAGGSSRATSRRRACSRSSACAARRSWSRTSG